MMKKIGVFLLIVLFIICAILGYSAASRVSPTLIQEPTPEVISPSAHSNQRNIVFIHVSSLQSETPDLVSAWAAFMTHTDRLQVTLKLLYPGPVKSNSWVKQLKLTPEHHLSTRFLDALHKNIPQLNGYFLVDLEALKLFTEWENQFLATPIQPFPDTFQNPLDNAKQEALLLKGVCASISGLEIARQPPPQWNILIPDHFQTDLTLEDALLLREFLGQSDGPAACKFVIQP